MEKVENLGLDNKKSMLRAFAGRELKKLKIDKNNPTFVISTFQTDITKLGPEFL